MKYNRGKWLILWVGLALVLAACGGGEPDGNGAAAEPSKEVPSGDPANGEVLFNQVCIACHGPAGAGIEGLGKNMVTSAFIRDQTEDELLTFVKTGRPVGDPLNTTGVDMPPKGGNPALTDEQLLDIIAYIRSLQTP